MSLNFKSNLVSTTSALKAVVFLKIRANSAATGPPLGATLGQYGVPAVLFCKVFNERTSHISTDVLLNVSLFLTISGEYKFHINLPVSSFFFKRSFLLESGFSKPGLLKSFLSSPKKPIITPFLIYEILVYKENITISSLSNFRQMLKKMEGSLKTIGFQIIN